jgi:ribosome-associated translation inhibitor RaiA
MVTVEQLSADQPAEPSTPVRVTLRGLQSASLRSYAQRKVGHVVDAVGQRPQDVRVVITSPPDPTPARPVTVEVDVLLDGQRVRAHATAAKPREAVDLVTHGLRRRLVEAGQRRVSRGRGERAHEDHPHLPVSRTPVEHPCTVRAAVAELLRGELSFLLFSEQVSGREAVVYRRTDGRIGIRGCLPADPADRSSVVVGPEAPVLRAEQARHRLDVADDDWFLLYRDPSDGRGRVVFRRRDGGHALVIPAG